MRLRNPPVYFFYTHYWKWDSKLKNNLQKKKKSFIAKNNIQLKFILKKKSLGVGKSFNSLLIGSCSVPYLD